MLKNDYSDLGAVTVETAPDYSDLGAIPTRSEEIRQAPMSQKSTFEKVVNFFKYEEKQIARSQNIYALSKVTGLPIG